MTNLWELMLRSELRESGYNIYDIKKVVTELPHLRDSLCCSVCNELMTNRVILSTLDCDKHLACKGCRGKGRAPGKKCQLCEDWDSFRENDNLHKEMIRYQELCDHILTTEAIIDAVQDYEDNVEEFETEKFLDLLVEATLGMSFISKPKKSLKSVCSVVQQRESAVISHNPTVVKRKIATVVGDEGSNKRRCAEVDALGITKTSPPVPIPVPITTASITATMGSTVSIKTSSPAVLVVRKLDESPNPKKLRGPNQTEPGGGGGKKILVVGTSSAEKLNLNNALKTSLMMSTSPFSSATTTTPKSLPVVISTTQQQQQIVSVSNVNVNSTIPTTSKIPVTLPIHTIVQSPPHPVTTIKIEPGTSEMSDKSEQTSSPTKVSEEEDTYILGLTSPPTSPKKSVPTTSHLGPFNTNVATTTIQSSPSVTPPSPVSVSSVPLRPVISSGIFTSPQRLGATFQILHTPGGPFKIGQPIRIAQPLPHGRIPIVVGQHMGGLPGTPGGPIIINTNMQKPSPGSSPVIVSNAGIVSALPPSSDSTQSGAPARRKIFVSTGALAISPDHQWADPNKCIQLHTGELGTFANLKPNVLSASVQAALQARARLPITTTAGLLVRPTNNAGVSVSPSIPTTTTGMRPPHSSVGPSVQPAQYKVAVPNVQFLRTASISGPGGPVILRPEGITNQQSQSTAPSQVQVTESISTSTNSSSSTTTNTLTVLSKRKQEGCRCGNATPTPGKLTCIGQRCACYVEKAACSNCKCKGCKNPYVPGGQKILHGVRALLDPQTNQAIPLLAAPMTSALSGGNQNVTFTSSNATAPASNLIAIGSSANFGSVQATGGGPPVQTSGPVQIIPIRYGPAGNFSPQYIQIATTQGISPLPFILSSSGGQLQAAAAAGGGITIQGLTMPVTGLGPTSTGIQQAVATQIQQHRPITFPSPATPPTTGNLKVDRNIND